MIVLKENNHIDETKLNKDESIIFIYILKKELIGHKCEMQKAHEQMYYDVGYLNSIFWKCQNENHKLDVEKIDACIYYLIRKWELQ